MITRYGNPDAGTVLIQMVDEHELEGLESEIAEIRKRTDRPFSLLAVRIKNWNRDLSPWTAPAVFGREDFGEGLQKPWQKCLRFVRIRIRPISSAGIR